MFKILKSSCVLGMLVVTASSATPIPPAPPQSEPTLEGPDFDRDYLQRRPAGDIRDGRHR